MICGIEKLRVVEKDIEKEIKHSGGFDTCSSIEDMRNRISFAGVDPVTFERINSYSRIGKKTERKGDKMAKQSRKNQDDAELFAKNAEAYYNRGFP